MGGPELSANGIGRSGRVGPERMDEADDERAGIAIIIAVGCVYPGLLAIWGQAPMESGDDFIFFLGTLAFGALFLFFAVPAALAACAPGAARILPRAAVGAR